jgi:hypothetical protein
MVCILQGRPVNMLSISLATLKPIRPPLWLHVQHDMSDHAILTAQACTTVNLGRVSNDDVNAYVTLSYAIILVVQCPVEQLIPPSSRVQTS